MYGLPWGYTFGNGVNVAPIARGVYEPLLATDLVFWVAISLAIGLTAFYAVARPANRGLKKAITELTLISSGIALGFGILYLTGLVGHPGFCAGGGGCMTSYGFPEIWSPSLGVYSEPMFATDMVFWVAVSLVVALISFHLLAPAVKRELKIHPSKNRWLHRNVHTKLDS